MMREHGLSCVRADVCGHHDSDHDGRSSEPAKEVVTTGTNELRVADITYSPSHQLVYLQPSWMPVAPRVAMPSAGHDARLASPRSEAIATRQRPRIASINPIRLAMLRGLPRRTRNTVSEARWVGAAIPTTTPRQKAS